MLGTKATIAVAVFTGVLLELGIHALSGRGEAWDSPQFWTIGLPAVLLVSAVLGFLARRRDWLWTFAIVPAQVTTMMVGSGENRQSLAAGRGPLRRPQRPVRRRGLHRVALPSNRLAREAC